MGKNQQSFDYCFLSVVRATNQDPVEPHWRRESSIHRIWLFKGSQSKISQETDEIRAKMRRRKARKNISNIEHSATDPTMILKISRVKVEENVYHQKRRIAALLTSELRSKVAKKLLTNWLFIHSDDCLLSRRYEVAKSQNVIARSTRRHLLRVCRH